MQTASLSRCMATTLLSDNLLAEPALHFRHGSKHSQRNRLPGGFVKGYPAIPCHKSLVTILPAASAIVAAHGSKSKRETVNLSREFTESKRPASNLQVLPDGVA
jgi:hypothetical protein